MKLTIDALNTELRDMRASGKTPAAIVCTRDQHTEFVMTVDARFLDDIKGPPSAATILGYPVNFVPAQPKRFVLDQDDARKVENRI